MVTPADKTVAFTFVSHPTKDLSWRWQAVVTFPGGSTAETVLPIRIADGNGNPVPKGTFEWAGMRLPVRDGAASVRYGDFVRGQHETALWLHRPDIPPIPGGLTFA